MSGSPRLSPLALLGGFPVCRNPRPSSNTIGEEEKRAVLEVLNSGLLSGFRAGPGPEFFGGPKVRKLEQEWDCLEVLCYPGNPNFPLESVLWVFDSGAVPKAQGICP